MNEVEDLKREVRNLNAQLEAIRRDCKHPNPRCVSGSYENRCEWNDMKCDLCGKTWSERD